MTQHVLTREVLYQEVWATPMVSVSARYGLSDCGLAKICASRGKTCRYSSRRIPSSAPLDSPLRGSLVAGRVHGISRVVSRASEASRGAPYSHVYILRCCDATLYVGHTSDLAARVDRHNLGFGPRYTATVDEHGNGESRRPPWSQTSAARRDRSGRVPLRTARDHPGIRAREGIRRGSFLM